MAATCERAFRRDETDRFDEPSIDNIVSAMLAAEEKHNLRQLVTVFDKVSVADRKVKYEYLRRGEVGHRPARQEGQRGPRQVRARDDWYP